MVNIKRDGQAYDHKNKDKDIAIDSELLGDQLSYGGSGNGQDTGHQHKEDDDDDVAAAAAASLVSDSDTANAAAAALSHQQPHHHHHHMHQHQHQQQMHQQMAYENHYGQLLHAAAATAVARHRVDNTILQPTTLPQTGGNKPQHGTEAWHRLRRENHKEVERRRRELINSGIKDLAALIPTPDTNKAQILQRAVEFIRRLKENENNNIEKWTLEKLLTEQAVSELNASNEKLKAELERAYREIEQLRRTLNEK
ncbi:hypothetical protein PUMCH_000634 [Australozyma saopauloensis]|uniref:BHLH domain-containing protein n=1 Tax=Australozyma saopauloensis TaxID=291208 RepID=A0AAX4H492_9ASCO|nr:hypothetical protein PUMCH_000634 [[Candida] saopauloensis]